jgi:prevent-host-death family protein
MKIAPLAEVKDRLSAYIDAARESAIIVTRNGKPVALLTPILEDDDLDSLLLASGA